MWRNDVFTIHSYYYKESESMPNWQVLNFLTAMKNKHVTMIYIYIHIYKSKNWIQKNIRFIFKLLSHYWSKFAIRKEDSRYPRELCWILSFIGRKLSTALTTAVPKILWIYCYVVWYLSFNCINELYRRAHHKTL